MKGFAAENDPTWAQSTQEFRGYLLPKILAEMGVEGDPFDTISMWECQRCHASIQFPMPPKHCVEVQGGCGRFVDDKEDPERSTVFAKLPVGFSWTRARADGRLSWDEAVAKVATAEGLDPAYVKQLAEEGGYFTLGQLAEVVVAKKEGGLPACPSCKTTAWVEERGNGFACIQCGRHLEPDSSEGAGPKVVVAKPVDPAEVHAEGSRLYEEIKDTLRVHYYFEQGWHYSIAALFVLQARVCISLPGVFYIFVGGRFGSGKTNVLDLLRQLTGGIMLENSSIPALARSIGHGTTICIDEIDVARGKEYDEVRDALLRAGYRADAAPYRRWDAKAKALELVPIYGPKAASYRGALEDALQSRGFMIPTAKPVGEGGFDYVLRSFWRKLGDLPPRLEAWGKMAMAAYPSATLEEVGWSPAFRERVKAATRELGGNRDSELAAIACLVGEMAGVDTAADLRAANEVRLMAITEGGGEDLEELQEVVVELMAGAPRLKLEAPGEVRLRQREVRDALNRRRRERGERPLDDRRFAGLRRELGITEGMCVKYGGAKIWCLPEEWPGGDGSPLAGMATITTTMPSQAPSDGSQGNQGSHGWPSGALDQAEELRRLREATEGKEFGPSDLTPELRRVFAKYLSFLLKNGHLWRPISSIERYKWLEGGGKQ